jgi:hypothetical protein
VRGARVVQLDRRRNQVRDEAGVIEKFGVTPESIPDYLAVVGDSADGFPGVPGWGAKAAAATLSRYRHLEDIPKDWREWDPSIRRARPLSESLLNSWPDALLFRTLATLRTDERLHPAPAHHKVAYRAGLAAPDALPLIGRRRSRPCDEGAALKQGKPSGLKSWAQVLIPRYRRYHRPIVSFPSLRVIIRSSLSLAPSSTCASDLPANNLQGLEWIPPHTIGGT